MSTGKQIRRGYIELPATSGGGQLHYRRAGTAGAPLLVLLHQTPSSSEMYLPLMRAMAAGFDLLAVDTPGFGLSDALPGHFSIAAAAGALHTAVQSLRPGPAFWFGHHTGAALALQIAHDHPQQVVRLAMSGPVCWMRNCGPACRRWRPRSRAPTTAVISQRFGRACGPRMPMRRRR